MKDAARDDSSSPAGAPQPAAGGMGAAGATEREPRSGGERVLRAELGFLGGLGCGFTPGCGLAHQLAIETKLLSRGDTHSSITVGWSLGVTVGGLFLTALGGLGDVAGGALSLSGVGAVLGVPVAVVATGAVVGGLANAGAGVRGLTQALQSTGSGGNSDPPVRNGHLAGKAHPSTGVPFDANGFPDFRAAGVVRAEVQIEFTGKRAADFSAANKAAGFERTPTDMTWHHHQDGRTMQLVPEALHRQTGHTGGFSLHRK